MKTTIAWGASKLLKMYLAHHPEKQKSFKYCIDSHYAEPSVSGLEVRRPEALREEIPGSFEVVIFAVSNNALRSISSELGKMGLRYRQDYRFYSDFFLAAFVAKIKKDLPLQLNSHLYETSLSSTLNSVVPVHTTILGNWLLLEILRTLQEMDRRYKRPSQ